MAGRGIISIIMQSVRLRRGTVYINNDVSNLNAGELIKENQLFVIKVKKNVNKASYCQV